MRAKMVPMDHKAAWRTRTREWAVAELGGCCFDCGSTERLEFDHADPGDKVFDISVGIRDGYGRDRLRSELVKCVLRCHTHHLEKSRAEGSLGGEPWNKIQDPQHGSSAMYTTGKCRCEKCREWKRLYRGGAVDARGNPVPVV